MHSANTASNNGGILFLAASSGTIEHSELRTSKAKLFGGGVYLQSAEGTTFFNSTLTQNTALQGMWTFISPGNTKLTNNHLCTRWWVFHAEWLSIAS